MPRKKAKTPRLSPKILKSMEASMREDTRADERERIRILIVGGTPEARTGVAMMVEFAVAHLSRGAVDSTFLERPTAVDAVTALEGYRVIIRDGGS